LSSSAARQAASMKTSGSRNVSLKASRTPVSGRSAKKRRTAAMLTSASLPVLTNHPSFSPDSRALLAMYEPKPPLCDTRATGPGGGSGTSGDKAKLAITMSCRFM
jgi:hypothetical protein